MDLHLLAMVLQVVVSLGLLNVWLVRSGLKTPYRGSNAASLKDEFKAYGLPFWFFCFIGILKVGAALILLLGLWLPSLVLPAALTVVFLMLGALAMHIKIGDPWLKSMPAVIMLLLSLSLCLLTSYR